MDWHIGQQAEQALCVLAREGPLEKRLAEARIQLVTVASEFFLDSAPSDIRACLQAVRMISPLEPTPDAARKIHAAIVTILDAEHCDTSSINWGSMLGLKSGRGFNENRF